MDERALLRRVHDDALALASSAGPHQLACDFGLPPGSVPLDRIAHVFAATCYAPPFVEAASLGALAGLSAYCEGAGGEGFRLAREAARIYGPFAFSDGGETTREAAEVLLEVLPEFEPDAVIDGAMLGFAEWLEDVLR